MASRVATRQTAQPRRADPQRTPSTRSTNAPVSLRPGIGELQRSAGNQAVHRLLQRRCQECTEEEEEKKKAGGPRSAGSEAQQADQNAVPAGLEDEKKDQPMLVRRGGRLILRKLTVNTANDPHEREADRVANQVTGMSPVGRATPPDIQRVTASDTKSRETTGAEESVVERALRGGEPLSTSTRSYLEPRFGRDLSDIRVHTGTEAAASTHALNARAYTTGNDIVFNTGQYSPGTTSGMNLLAHEVTHSVQQSGARGHAQRTIGDGHDLASPRFALDPVLEACFDNERVLEFGAVGPSVATIQHALVEGGFLLPAFGVDGIFRAETRQAVRDFQTAQGLTGAAVDGRIGPTTMGLLDAAFPTAVAAGPAPIPNVPAPSGTAPALNAVVTTAPTPGNCGIMNFVVTWNLSANAGTRGGFIIQDLTITWNEQDCAGNPVADPQGHVSPLRYWEAWRVAPNSPTSTPVTTDTFQWAPGLGTGCTNDTVRFNGTAQFHNNVAALPNHMTANNPATKAGILQSSTSDPNVGGDTSAAVVHTLDFHWTCCVPFFGFCFPNPTVVDGHTP